MDKGVPYPFRKRKSFFNLFSYASISVVMVGWVLAVPIPRNRRYAGARNSRITGASEASQVQVPDENPKVLNRK